MNGESHNGSLEDSTNNRRVLSQGYTLPQYSLDQSLTEHFYLADYFFYIFKGKQSRKAISSHSVYGFVPQTKRWGRWSNSSWRLQWKDRPPQSQTSGMFRNILWHFKRILESDLIFILISGYFFWGGGGLLLHHCMQALSTKVVSPSSVKKNTGILLGQDSNQDICHSRAMSHQQDHWECPVARGSSNPIF